MSILVFLGLGFLVVCGEIDASGRALAVFGVGIRRRLLWLDPFWEFSLSRVAFLGFRFGFWLILGLDAFCFGGLFGFDDLDFDFVLGLCSVGLLLLLWFDFV